MNICYLIDVAPDRMAGGGQVHLLNLVQEMQSQISNLKSQIYGANNAGFLSRIIWMIIVIPQVFFHHFFLRRFDLIHAHSIPGMITGKALSLILRIPIVVTIHGNVFGITQRPVIPRVLVPSKAEGTRNLSRIKSGTNYRFLTRFAESRRVRSGMRMKIVLEKIVLTKIHYDAQITVSRDFLKISNVNKNVICIPNGVDLSRFKRSDLGVRQGQTFSGAPIVLFVGRKNDPVKGFPILEQAMKHVRQEVPSSSLRVVSDLPQRELAKEYKRATLLVISSLSEGFPLTLLEAWASKLPVVATTVGEIPYLVKDGVNGFLVPSGDARELADGILRAFKHKNLARLGENGYNLAKRYTWKRVARETSLVYRDVLSDRLTH